MVLLIDNYDSFTFNLKQLILMLHQECRVVRNDQTTTDEIAALEPDAIVLSPGPGDPKSAGICLEVVRRFAGQVPIFGVCLGHQVITEALGGRVVRAKSPRHGKTSMVSRTEHPLLHNLEDPFQAMRYHSLVAEVESLPEQLEVIASANDTGDIMAIAHRSWPVFGVQFHPESIGTPQGTQLMRNFFRCIEGFSKPSPGLKNVKNYSAVI